MNLAADFPPASEAEWLERATASHKGKPLGALTVRTLDGIDIRPLYARSTAPAPLDLPRRPGAWVAMQRVDLPDPAAANRQGLEDLENGASGLALVLPGAATAGAGGLAIESADDIRRILDGIEVDLIGVRLDPGEGALDSASLLLDLYRARGLDLSRCDLALGLHPLSAMAGTGALVEESSAAASASDLARRAIDLGFSGQAFLADTRVWHGAGATEAQELALALAEAVALLRWLERAGIDPESGADLIGFLLAADADQFMTIARFRAVRLLWQRARDAMGLDPRPVRLHAETSWRMLSRRDPHVNLLRSATAAFAAGVGGADSVTVLPFTAANGLPDAFARRLTRNIQSLLIEEAGLARVADPAAGSGYAEALTLELAAKAWSLFQEIEAEGGLYAALLAGSVQRRIADAAEKRRALIARRKLPITGVSEFPLLDDGGDTPPPLAGEGGAKRRMRGPSSSPASGEGLAPLPQHRLAEPFERLRDAADAARPRPAVYLANVGSIADFNARSAWIGNLLAAGGIASIHGSGGTDADAIAGAFAESGACLACLCSSDALYAEHAVRLARALKAAGAREVLFAGRPGALEADLKAAGVDYFLIAGDDVLAALSRLHRVLGLAPEADNP